MSGVVIAAAVAAACSVWWLFPAASRLSADQRQWSARTITGEFAHELRRAVTPQPASRARDIAALASALATELRSGQSPDAAWQHVQAANLGLAPGLVVDGADVAAVLQRCARQPGWSGLAAVAVCWRLADATGAGLADALDRVGEALEANQEAIVTLAPAFLAQPPAFAHWMRPMCGQYVERCEKLGREPDWELLAPIAVALQRLEEGGGQG